MFTFIGFPFHTHFWLCFEIVGFAEETEKKKKKKKK